MARDLTEREIEIVQHLAYGKSNSEIGRALYLSPDTIKTHLRRISQKLGARGRTDIVGRCMRAGIVE